MKTPHFRVEYDLDYWGGDYNMVGNYALIPESLADEYGTVEKAFQKQTGHDPIHIIHYSEDELYDADGNFYNE